MRIKKILSILFAIVMMLSFCITSYASDNSAEDSNEYQAYYDAIDYLNEKYDAHMQIQTEECLDNYTVEEFIDTVESYYIQIEDIDKGRVTYEIEPIDEPIISPRSTSVQYCILKGSSTVQYGRLGLRTTVNDSMRRYSTVQTVWSESNDWNTYFVTQRHSEYFSTNNTKCHVAYTGYYYNQGTGVVLTTVRTYNVTYTCFGGSLTMNVGLIS